MSLVLRPFQPSDAGFVADLFNRFEQELETAATLLDRFARYPKDLPIARWIAEVEGVPVGYANSLRVTQVQDGIFFIRVEVADEWQHRGIGRQLIQAAERFAVEHDTLWMMSKVRDDLVRERQFLEAAGFSEMQHLYGVELDLSTARLTGHIPDSIRIEDWSKLGDTEEARRRLFDLYYAADSDTPGIELWGQAGYEDWVPTVFNARWFRPEGCLVAVTDDGQWVGLSLIGPTGDGEFTTDFTGVRRDYRGKGVAQALKEAGVRWAKVCAGTKLHTFNDDRNGAMRSINAKLGFVAKTGWRMMKKE